MTQTLRERPDRGVLLHRITNRIRKSLELQEILTATVAEVRSFLDTDRVMLYRFNTDGSGEVIAEALGPETQCPPLLGLNFPADDIPDAAREMYVKTRARSIVDVSSGKLGLSPLEPQQENVVYRELDPCHATYLSAMGVSSSVVLPLLHREQLWGLLVAHHSQPRQISEDELEIVQLVADQVTIAIEQSYLLGEVRDRARREGTVNRISTLLHAQPGIQLQAALEAAVKALNGSGGRLFALVDRTFTAKASFSIGDAPAPMTATDGNIETHPMWQHWLQDVTAIRAVSDIYQTPQLRVLLPAFRPTLIRGMLVVPLYYRQQLVGYLSVFRREQDVERLWAGQFDPSSKQEMPRQSFEVWRETKRGQAPQWTDSDLELARAVGEQFAMALEQYILYERVRSLNTNLEAQVADRTAQLQQTLDFNELLARVTDRIRSSLDTEEILSAIATQVRELLDVDRAVIYHLEGNCGEVVAETARDDLPSLLGQKEPCQCEEGDLSHPYRQGRIVAIENTDMLSECYREFYAQSGIKASLVVPIRQEGQLWGLLEVHQCDGPRMWKKAEKTWLAQLADRAAIAIAHAQLYERSQAQSRELEAAFDRLKHTQTQLIQNEKMSSLGQLVAGVAHEINNPVNFIYGNLVHASEYARDLMGLVSLYQECHPQTDPEIEERAEEIDLEFLMEDLPKLLGSMQVGADRIRAIVSSLRNFSRGDRSGPIAIDLRQGIEDTLMILHHRLKAKTDRPAIKVVKNYGTIPPVECYAGELNQVFTNIIGNAIDALESDERFWRDPQRRMTLEISTTAIEGDRVRIVISDNGPGIPERLISQIFDPFFTTKPVGVGTGLGLSIGYQIIVEKHRGSLNCTSNPGEGTTFTIEIPTRQVASLNVRAQAMGAAKR